MVAFDVATSIAEFLADAERTTLQLPHMTTGQRKSTKKMLEEFVELRCESFGFGTERQLHLFKSCTDNVQQEEDCGVTTSVGEMMSTGKSDISSPDFLTTATSTSTKDSAFGGSPTAREGEIPLPLKHEKLQVRNTFIHFEGASVDERAVKSMPHGMFKQCLLAEFSQEYMGYTGYDTPTTASEPDLEQTPCVGETHVGHRLALSVGALVVVEGLVRVPAFNGRSAVVQGFDEATGRYSILLASSDGCQEARVKEGNLRMVLPCP